MSVVHFNQQYDRIAHEFEALQNAFFEGKRDVKELTVEIDRLFAQTTALNEEIEQEGSNSPTLSNVKQLLDNISHFFDAINPSQTRGTKRKAVDDLTEPRKKIRLDTIIEDVETPDLNLRSSENDTLVHLKIKYRGKPLEKGIDKLIANGYESYLPVRGDGNCYYRAFYVSILQEGLKEGKESWVLKQFIDQIVDSKPPPSEELLNILTSAQKDGTWLQSQDLVKHIATNRAFDQEMIRVVRNHLSQFIETTKNQPLQNGMTPQEMADSMDLDLERFRHQVVEKMGEEATDLIIPMLANAFKTKITVAILDPQSVNIDTYGSGDKNFIHILYRPQDGHYDILYKR